MFYNGTYIPDDAIWPPFLVEEEMVREPAEAVRWLRTHLWWDEVLTEAERAELAARLGGVTANAEWRRLSWTQQAWLMAELDAATERGEIAPTEPIRIPRRKSALNGMLSLALTVRQGHLVGLALADEPWDEWPRGRAEAAEAFRQAVREEGQPVVLLPVTCWDRFATIRSFVPVLYRTAAGWRIGNEDGRSQSLTAAMPEAVWEAMTFLVSWYDEEQAAWLQEVKQEADGLPETANRPAWVWRLDRDREWSIRADDEAEVRVVSQTHNREFYLVAREFGQVEQRLFEGRPPVAEQVTEVVARRLSLPLPPPPAEDVEAAWLARIGGKLRAAPDAVDTRGVLSKELAAFQVQTNKHGEAVVVWGPGAQFTQVQGVVLEAGQPKAVLWVDDETLRLVPLARTIPRQKMVWAKTPVADHDFGDGATHRALAAWSAAVVLGRRRARAARRRRAG